MFRKYLLWLQVLPMQCGNDYVAFYLINPHILLYSFWLCEDFLFPRNASLYYRIGFTDSLKTFLLIYLCLCYTSSVACEKWQAYKYIASKFLIMLYYYQILVLIFLSHCLLSISTGFYFFFQLIVLLIDLSSCASVFQWTLPFSLRNGGAYAQSNEDWLICSKKTYKTCANWKKTCWQFETWW